MNKNILSLTLLLTLMLITACGGSAAQTPLETAAPTETVSQPTAVPAATEAATSTEAASTDATSATTTSFANNVMPILEAKCIKCHGVEAKKEGLDLRTYEDLMAGSRNGSVLTPGDASNSVLVDLIQRGKMPNRGPKLTPEEIQTIIDWVNQGALNN
jgi:mono/diheme cytochrome c family protein